MSPRLASCFLLHNGPGFTTQVANAARLNASAVLIYADPEDYSLEDTAELFGHVSEPLGAPPAVVPTVSQRLPELSVLLFAWGSTLKSFFFLL